MMRSICVCEIDGDQQYWSIIDQWHKGEIEITGHWNSAGGYCCPHSGNTCGFHPEYDSQEVSNAS